VVAALKGNRRGTPERKKEKSSSRQKGLLTLEKVRNSFMVKKGGGYSNKRAK